MVCASALSFPDGKICAIQESSIIIIIIVIIVCILILASSEYGSKIGFQAGRCMMSKAGMGKVLPRTLSGTLRAGNWFRFADPPEKYLFSQI